MLKKLGALKVKFPILTFFTYLTLVLVTLAGCYLRFSYNMRASYEQHGKEILNLASEDIVIDNIPKYLSGDYDEAEYEKTAKKLDLYPEYFDEVFYLYAYSLNGDGLNGTYLFDASVDHDDPASLGENYEIEADIRAQIAKHGAGQQLDTVMDNTEWGYLMTCSKPLIDSKGNFQGYILIDFDLTKVRENNIWFIIRLFILVFALILVIFAFGMQAVAIRITTPIEKMYLCLSNFKYVTTQDREENLRSLKELNIHTNHEIQSLYEALIASAESSLRYITEYRTITAKLGAVNKMAHTDVLTGVNNKTAFDDRVSELLGRTANEDHPEIAVIMADINNLKYVNDKFGHKTGDDYIKGCCRIMSDFCKFSQIYRIGGDEFIIFLAGEDYKNRKLLYQMLRSQFIDTYTDTSRDPGSRYSVSLGLAEYESTDSGLSEMIKRADDAMYQEKKIFKETYGSYR
jgi:diguanylate cyclase (GGDEF)-like protein